MKIKELNTDERLNSRITICIEKASSLSESIVNRMKMCKKFLTNIDVESIENNDLKNEIKLIKEKLVLIEIDETLVDKKSNLTVPEYVKTYIKDIDTMNLESAGAVAELWLITKIAVEVDEHLQNFLDTIFKIGNDYIEFEKLLNSISVDSLNNIKKVYVEEGGSKGLDLLRKEIKMIGEKIMQEVKVTDNVTAIEKEVEKEVEVVKAEVKESAKVDTELNKKDVETKEENSSTFKIRIDGSTLLKAAGIVAITAGTLYLGKKIYDHYTSDDVVIIDSEGIDFGKASDAFNAITESQTESILAELF